MNAISTTARSLWPKSLWPARFSSASTTPAASTSAATTTDAGATNAQACSLALPAACWILRVAVAIMCWGLAAKVLFITYSAETEIFEALYIVQLGHGTLFENAWTEEQAKAVDHNGAWYYFLAGLAIVILPAIVAGLRKAPPTHKFGEMATRWGLYWQTPLLVAISLWTLLIAWGDATLSGGFMADWAVVAHFARILTPIGLIFWLAAAMQPSELSPGFKRKAFILTGETILRVGIAVTFFMHGLEAFFHNPHFIDLILLTDMNHFHLGLKQAAAEDVLTIIGIVDIVIAVAIVCGRYRSIALWMAFWGILTAFSRVTALGWGKYPEILLRAAHAGAPLALFVYWQWGIPRTSTPSATPSPAEEPTA